MIDSQLIWLLLCSTLTTPCLERSADRSNFVTVCRCHYYQPLPLSSHGSLIVSGPIFSPRWMDFDDTLDLRRSIHLVDSCWQLTISLCTTWLYCTDAAYRSRLNRISPSLPERTGLLMSAWICADRLIFMRFAWRGKSGSTFSVSGYRINEC